MGNEIYVYVFAKFFEEKITRETGLGGRLKTKLLSECEDID
jgi:hypothetical protein